MNKVFNLAGLVVLGVILANVLAKPAGTKSFFDGIGGLWKVSINGLLGTTSK